MIGAVAYVSLGLVLYPLVCWIRAYVRRRIKGE